MQIEREKTAKDERKEAMRKKKLEQGKVTNDGLDDLVSGIDGLGKHIIYYYISLIHIISH